MTPHDCPPVVAVGCAPWPPRHCEACGACEAATGFVYRTDGEGGTYREKHPRRLCRDCYETARPPRQPSLWGAA